MTKEIGNSNLLDTWGATGTIVEPSGTKKDSGWLLGEQPPHEYANWVLNVMGKAINHVLQNGIPIWNNTTTYAENNFVSHDGIIYRSKQSNLDSEPPNINWQAIAPYTAHWSVEYLDGFLQLVGDVEDPGNNKIYGTDGSGDRGWQDAPVQADGFKTGDVKLRYGTGALAGYCRLNGNSIGNASSAATERANADTEDLFKHLWENSTNAILAVSGGRGASAQADFDANKNIALPDWRARVPACIDGHGAANLGRVSNTGDGNPGVDSSVLGASGGVDRLALTVPQLPEHNHSLRAESVQSGSGSLVADTSPYISGSEAITDVAGGNEPHPNLQPTTFAGYYIKL
jgi:microcystin-dependent protein